MSENGLDSKTAQLPQTSAGAAVPVSLLPDLSLPELKDTGGGPPGASGGQGPPSVLQKLQKWGDYPSYGEPVQPTLFIPMKTPLSTTIHWGWTLPTPPLHSLTVQQLLAEQAAKQHTVGLILDLSNHATLYTEDLPPGLEYEHIMLQSKVFPHPAAINEVVKAARSFWSRQPSQYIAIHCAYGFNRTGFVVCSYLIQACGLSVEAALAAFAAARPPGVKHEQFVAELHSRYPAASSRCSTGGDMATGQQSSSAAAARMEMAPGPYDHQSGHSGGPSGAGSRANEGSQSATEAHEPAAAEATRLPSVSGQAAPKQHSWHRAATSEPLPWPDKSACISTKHTEPVRNGFQQHHQPEQCSHCGGVQVPRTCRCQLHSTSAQSASAHDLLTRPPSQGVENDSLGLDQRAIMAQLAASRMPAG
ncbi:hypothetical protein WJX74_004729 [Apatococcus lobatus]|uniref:Tyrosine specific protein phosphatases domain-containing protein n=1 Tax=Apatococcus lobatus TaxID=904363 RepID=A0AAW1QKR1_9CHLO